MSDGAVSDESEALSRDLLRDRRQHISESAAARQLLAESAGSGTVDDGEAAAASPRSSQRSHLTR
jgi:hypothetical protein